MWPAILRAHRLAVAHDQRRPRPARDALAARDRAVRHHVIDDELVVRGAGKLQLDLLDRADASAG